MWAGGGGGGSFGNITLCNTIVVHSSYDSLSVMNFVQLNKCSEAFGTCTGQAPVPTLQEQLVTPCIAMFASALHSYSTRQLIHATVYCSCQHYRHGHYEVSAIAECMYTNWSDIV